MELHLAACDHVLEWWQVEITDADHGGDPPIPPWKRSIHVRAVWSLVSGTGSLRFGVAPDREAAIDAARQLLAQEGGQLVIHDVTGAVTAQESVAASSPGVDVPIDYEPKDVPQLCVAFAFVAGPALPSTPMVFPDGVTVRPGRGFELRRSETAEVALNT